MTTVSLGANSKIAALPSERERIQQFYRDILGCTVDIKPEADLIWLRPDFYLGVVYEDPASSESQLLMAIWLELRVDNPDELEEKILKFGVTTIDYPRDEDHFYFQAPGGQVFRLVSHGEEMNFYRPHGNAVSPRSKRRIARAVADGDTVLATVDVATPPERVFRALTTDELEGWWGSADTYRMTEWIADLRVGGRWSVLVRAADGQTFPATGEFLEIDAPRKVVQKRKYEWNHPLLGRRATTVTYRFEPIPPGTRVTVRHEGFAGLSEAADEHAMGWERVLGWLDAHLRPGP
jgi:uncharacterized protein YndB with AHSA1/START domain